jgi:tRNA G10  N-methylase Trm11
VRSLSENIPFASINAIVTEPFLGPPLYQKPRGEKIKDIFSQLQSLYLGAFREFAKILEKQGKIAIIFPAFMANGKLHCMEILNEVNKMGLKMVNYLPSDLPKEISLYISQRNTILYGGTDYFVQREIILLEKI